MALLSILIYLRGFRQTAHIVYFMKLSLKIFIPHGFLFLLDKYHLIVPILFLKFWYFFSPIFIAIRKKRSYSDIRTKKTDVSQRKPEYKVEEMYMKNKWLKNSNRQHLRYSMRQASGIALALVMGISVAAAGHTQSVKAAVDTQTADTGVTATTDTANQTTETTTIGKNQISIKDFASQVQKVTGKDVLKNAGIKNTAAATTNEIAAYLLNEADSAVNGGENSYNYDLYGYVKYFNRISDIKKADDKYKESLYKCFTKGIMVGKNDGTYSSTRKFLPKIKITKDEAKKMMNRLKNKGKRFKLSYDGQVLRIINLPKNYKDYPYILASFPNSYYEKETSATKQKRKGSKTPAQTSKILSDEDKDMICAKIKKNVELRLNVDYRKTFTSKWKSDLMNTYIDPNKQKSVNAYIKAAKARKVVLSSGKVIVDPSSLWIDDAGICYARVYVKFRVEKGKIPSVKSKLQNEVIYGSYTAVKNLSSKKTITYLNDQGCDLSYTGKALTSYGLAWYFDGIDNYY
mgnify:CR=1 FL=1